MINKQETREGTKRERREARGQKRTATRRREKTVFISDGKDRYRLGGKIKREVERGVYLSGSFEDSLCHDLL